MTGKKSTKKRDARAKLFCQSKPFATFQLSLTSPSSLVKLPIASRPRPVFSVTDKKVKNCPEIDTYGTSMINRSNPVLIVFHLYWCSKHYLSTILLASVANLASFFHKENTKEINV